MGRLVQYLACEYAGLAAAEQPVGDGRSDGKSRSQWKAMGHAKRYQPAELGGGLRVYAAQLKPVVSGRGASGLAGSSPAGSSSL
jgi:hypothetical protein